MPNKFLEHHIPELPGLKISRINQLGVFNYYFSGAHTGDLTVLDPGFVFADTSVFPELTYYLGEPVQVLGARIPVLGHSIETVVFEIDTEGIRLSNLWGGFVRLGRHDALAGSQVLVLDV